MTSQKSSISTFSFTFWSALKGNFVLPLLNLIALTVFVPVLSFLSIKNFSSSNTVYDTATSGVKEAAAQKITDVYKFLIFGQMNEGPLNIFIHLSVIAFSVLLGIVMFRFIASKKTVNVFYSLGITRKNMFASKFLAGALMLIVSIAVPFFACLILNISTFGSSTELWSAIIYHIIGYSVLALTTFSVTAAVFSCVGTIIEGIAFSGVVLAGPTMVYYSIQFLMNKLTLGSPYSQRGYFYDAAQTATSLAGSLSKYNPILFLYKNVSKVGSLYRESSEAKFVWSAPVYTNVILWLVIAAAVFILGMVLFQKRKAEICGFLGVNKWLNFVITFLLGFFPFCIAVSNIDLSLFVAVLIGAGIYIFIYLVVDFALIRNFKEWAKGLYKLPIHLGAALLIVLVFTTGLFGYSSRIPAIETIESVDISAPAYTGIINPSNQNYGGNGDFLYSVGINSPVTGFNSTKDLKTITELHNLLIKTGKLKADTLDFSLPADKQIANTAISINYHLKNGKIISRFYDKATMEIINAMLAVDDTDRYKDLTLRNLTEPISNNDDEQTIQNKNMFQGDSTSSQISIIPNHLNIAHKIDITSEQRKKLLSAIAKDLKVQTAKQRYYPGQPALGVIQFATVNTEETGDTKNIQAQPDVNINPAIGLASYGTTCIVITKDMTNTLRFLEDNGFMELFDNSAGSEFVSADVISASLSGIDYYYGSNPSFHFMGGWNKTSENQSGIFVDTYKVTDKALINDMAANANISYFNGVKGYYVRFELKDNGGYTTMYIPANKMPQSVIDGVASYVQKNPQYSAYMG